MMYHSVAVYLFNTSIMPVCHHILDVIEVIFFDS